MITSSMSGNFLLLLGTLSCMTKRIMYYIMYKYVMVDLDTNKKLLSTAVHLLLLSTAVANARRACVNN